MNYKNSIYKISLILIFSVACFQHLFSQEIKGKITDIDENPIQSITVTIKSSINDSIILEYATSDEFGNYKLNITSDLDSFFIEFRALSYLSKTIEILDFTKKNKPYILNVSLETNITSLKEVTVNSSKNRAIQVKKDTVIFDPNKFKDGTERVVEDLIKKLPGMKVEENGRISFKGNPVENILLDGDDLFDKNYTIGSKNIDVDMIDKLAAIENYIENPLLHGIEKSKAVAINLILKKGKTDFSNNTSLGLGIENKQDINTNTIGISKTLKSFSTLSYNNIGKESSPYDYFSSNNISLEDIKEQEFKLPKIIEDGDFTTQMSDEKSRINNNLFTSINAIYNLTNNFGVRINFNYKKDKLIRNLLSQTTYKSNLLDIIQSEDLVKKPEIINLNLKLNYKISVNSLLEYKIKIEDGTINTNNIIVLNDIAQESKIFSNEKQFKQILNYTKRLNKDNAFVSNLIFNTSKFSQNLNISPDLRLGISEPLSNQSVNLKKTYFSFKAIFLRNRNNLNLKLGAGYTFVKNEMSSLLINENINSNFSISDNDLIIQNSLPWLEGSLVFRKENWSFNTNLRIIYLNEKIENIINNNYSKDIQRLLVLPNITIYYYVNKQSNINLYSGYDEKNIDIEYLYGNTIFTSNRSAIRNNIELETLKSYIAKISYNHNDFFNLLQFNLSVNYLRNKNNFFSKVTFNNLFFESNRNLSDLNFDNTFLNLSFDKYINYIKSNVKLVGSFSINSYKNEVDNSQIRDNISYNGFYGLNLKTGFLKKINFENNLQIRTSSFKTDNFKTFNNLSIQNTFKIYVKPTNRLRFVTSFDYYLPNNKDLKNNFIFFDNSIYFSSKNGSLNYTLTSRNFIAKQNTFSKIDFSDYSRTITSYGLLDPYIMLSVDFKF